MRGGGGGVGLQVRGERGVLVRGGGEFYFDKICSWGELWPMLTGRLTLCNSQ